MEIELLQKFCSTDAVRFEICEPYSWGLYTFATNGHLQLRILRMPEIEEKEHAPAIEFLESDKVGRHYLKEPVSWVPLPETTIQPELCFHCKGSGIAFVCPECHGDGSVDLSTEFNNYDSVMCKTCNGFEQVSEAGFRSLQSHQFKTLEKKQVSCDYCMFGEVWPNHAEDVNGVLLKSQYVHLLSLLPAVEIGTFPDPNDVVRFRFQGGDGLIMPMRKQ